VIEDEDEDAEARELTHARYFTPDEANALLAEILPTMAEAKSLLEQAQTLVAGVESEAVPSVREQAVAEVKVVQDRLRTLLERVKQQGVEVKGVSPGLLDFPALRYGQEVFLCWKEGEDHITWWHPIPTGIAGRQRLADTESGAWEWCN
jgi:hypothetical protein